MESLLKNASQPVEVIVHDDGSTDPVVEATLLTLKRQGKISLLMLNAPGHNQGQGIALNRMFNAAKGDIIWKVDQDLIFQREWLDLANFIFEENDEQSALGNEPRIGLLGGFHYWHEPCDSNKTTIEEFDNWTSRTHILGSCFAVTRECWEALKPFEERSEAFAEDWDFQNRVTASKDFVCGLPNRDLVVNRGFGPGPSTIVYEEQGEIKVTKIKNSPYWVESHA